MFEFSKHLDFYLSGIMQEFVVLDFETTGLSPLRHRVIEVGAAVVRGNEIISTFQELCNPGVKVSSFITKFTGITNEMLASQDSPSVVMLKLYNFIGNRPIIAHNASFDSKFLFAEMKRIKKSISNQFLCTLQLSRRLLHGLQSYKLSSLKKYINFVGDKNHSDHRALDDVLVTVQLWIFLQDTVRNVGVEGYNSLELYKEISKLPKIRVFEFLRLKSVGYGQSLTMPTCIPLTGQFHEDSNHHKGGSPVSIAFIDDSNEELVAPKKRRSSRLSLSTDENGGGKAARRHASLPLPAIRVRTRQSTCQGNLLTWLKTYQSADVESIAVDATTKLMTCAAGTGGEQAEGVLLERFSTI